MANRNRNCVEVKVINPTLPYTSIQATSDHVQSVIRQGKLEGTIFRNASSLRTT